MSYHTAQHTKIQSLIQSKLSPSSWDAVECFFNPSLETRSPSTYKKEKGHYVYIQFAHGDTEPFYVGQGNHRGGGFFRRCYDMQSKQQRRTKRHPNCWIDKASLGFYAWLINNLSQEDANTLEIVLIAHYGRLDEGQGPLFDRTSGGKRTGSRIPATGWHHSEETKAKISKSRKGQVHSIETRKLMSQQRRGVPLTEAHKKAVSQGKLGLPQVRKKCLYCEVVASPANLATYHNDHCLHRPGYEAINQARRDQVSGERMNRRNQLIEKRRQWLHQTLDTLSPEEKQATGLMSPVKQEGKIQQVWGPIPYQCETTGQWYSVNLKEATRQYKEWVASQDRN